MVPYQILDRVRRDRRGLLNTERLLQGMKLDGIDAAIAVSPTNATYTGGSLFPTMQAANLLRFVVTTADGVQGAVLNEADLASFKASSWIENTRTYQIAHSRLTANSEAINQLIDLLVDLGLENAKVGIEETHIAQTYMEKIRKLLPKTRFLDSTGALEHARLVKTKDEIDVYRVAAFYTDKAIQVAFALAKPGDAEQELAGTMREIVLGLGADDLVHAHFQTGVHSTVVHAWPTELPLRSGEVVHVDTGAVFGGYRTDLARNAVVEEPTAKQEQIYRHMWEIEQLVIERMRPGALAGSLYDFAMGEFARVGLTYPWGTLGHSIGITGHEGFEIARGSDQVLEPGMLVNVEPSHIEHNDARYHIEDTVLVTEGQPEVLSNFADTQELFRIC